MKELHILLIFAGLLVVTNVTFIFIKDYNVWLQILVNAFIIIFGLVVFIYNRNSNRSKPLSESIKAGRQFYNIAMFNSSGTEPPLNLLEAAKYKEEVLKTRKNEVNAVVFENTDDGRKVLVKDDPFIRRGADGVVFFNPNTDFNTQAYKSKTEMEREIRYAAAEKKREPKSKYKLKVKKEEEKVTA